MATMTQEERFLHQVRLLQRKTKCSNTVCDEFVRIYKQHCDGNSAPSLRTFDTKAKRAAGMEYIVLHGCPKCKKYVYGPNNTNANCPFVEQDGTVCGHTRYNKETNKPWEVSLLACLLACLLVRLTDAVD